MVKLNSDLTRGLELFAKRHKEFIAQTQSQSTTSSIKTDVVHIEKSSQQSFTFFYRSVNASLEKAMDAKMNKLEQELAEKQLAAKEKRSDVAANNILKFIEKQLNSDIKDGASMEELESRINAGLEGFNIGYEEANQALEEMELLNPELSDEISMTKDKVLAGIEQLKQEYLGSELETEDDSASNSEQKVSNEQAYVQGQAFSAENNFSFELTTNDGDIVTINTQALMAMKSESGYYASQQNGELVEMAYQSQSGLVESNFAFSVEGDLDEGELKAINNLLNNVNDIAADFYQGDVNKAFEKALNLNYDSAEISEFSVSMTQITNYSAYQAYQTNSPLSNNDTFAELKPLADFASQVQDNFNSIKDLFAHPRDLMSDVMKQINNLNKPLEYPETRTDFVDFANQLLDMYQK